MHSPSPAQCIDNQVYDRMADSWWEEDGLLHAILTLLNPVRFTYGRDVFARCGLGPGQGRLLDVGCGGGLLAEEFARAGYDVVGIDPSGRSIAAAAAHARDSGLSIAYEWAHAESIPFGDGAFAGVYCCDVLEHVEGLSGAVSEINRVLQPGGTFVFDTVNRTFASWLVGIYLMQQCRWTAIMPENFHLYRMFIKPSELAHLLARVGMEPAEFRGLWCGGNPFRALSMLRACRSGRLPYAEAGRAMAFRLHPYRGLMYIGHAHKPGASPR